MKQLAIHRSYLEANSEMVPDYLSEPMYFSPFAQLRLLIDSMQPARRLNAFYTLVLRMVLAFREKLSHSNSNSFSSEEKWFTITRAVKPRRGVSHPFISVTYRRKSI